MKCLTRHPTNKQFLWFLAVMHDLMLWSIFWNKSDCYHYPPTSSFSILSLLKQPLFLISLVFWLVMPWSCPSVTRMRQTFTVDWGMFSYSSLLLSFVSVKVMWSSFGCSWEKMNLTYFPVLKSSWPEFFPSSRMQIMKRMSWNGL